MDYPLMIDGAACGSASCTQDGLYTVFEASLNRPEKGLVRLWVHGGGESAYLGLMQPWSGGLYLCRRLSRRERAQFPAEIECVSNQESLHNTHNQERGGETGREHESLHNIKDPVIPDRCAYPSPVPQQPDGLLWLRRADGSLTAFDGVSSLLALPTTLPAGRPGAVICRIDGQNYLIFRY